MWNPPIALTPEEQKIVARTRKTRKFFVFLRERRHEILEADFQHTLAQSYSAEAGGKAPVEAGLLALATLLQASCNVSDRDAVELTVMDKRWQMVLDGLGAAQPPFSQSTLLNFRLRLIAPNLDKTLLDRTVAVAEQTGGWIPAPTCLIGSMGNLLYGKDSRWLQLDVCREFVRSKCCRSDQECRYAHPPPNVEVQNGRVMCCFDSIKVCTTYSLLFYCYKFYWFVTKIFFLPWSRRL